MRLSTFFYNLTSKLIFMNFIAQNFYHYHQLYKESIDNPEQFWNNFAQTEFTWKKPWDNTLSWDFKEAKVKWFDGAELNITENCLDRHLDTIGQKTAIIWEPNDPNEAEIKLTYNQLHAEVCRFANTLLRLGISKGDRVCIYLPMVPELAIATLACARIGAIHSVVFAGFSAQSLKDRINDSACKIILTADGGFTGDKITPLKDIVDQALQDCPSIEHCLVLKRTNIPISMGPKDKWWSVENDRSDTHCYTAECHGNPCRCWP